MKGVDLSSGRHRNGLTFTVAGILVLALGVGALSQHWLGPGMLLILVGPVLLILGVGKLTEPVNNLSVNDQSLSLHHRRGGWSLKWTDIQRLDQLTLGQGFAARELPYIGFRLKNPDCILATISPRLAVGLLTEQRNLLVLALRQQCPSCQADDLFEDNHYISPGGVHYSGVIAMLGNRMARLRALTGFDLLMAEELAGDNGLGLLRRYWAAGQAPRD